MTGACGSMRPWTDTLCVFKTSDQWVLFAFEESLIAVRSEVFQSANRTAGRGSATITKIDPVDSGTLGHKRGCEVLFEEGYRQMLPPGSGFAQEGTCQICAKS